MHLNYFNNKALISFFLIFAPITQSLPVAIALVSLISYCPGTTSNSYQVFSPLTIPLARSTVPKSSDSDNVFNDSAKPA